MNSTADKNLPKKISLGKRNSLSVRMITPQSFHRLEPRRIEFCRFMICWNFRREKVKIFPKLICQRISNLDRGPHTAGHFPTAVASKCRRTKWKLTAEVIEHSRPCCRDFQTVINNCSRSHLPIWREKRSDNN